MSDSDKKVSGVYATKRCAYCRTHNKIDAETCINELSCGKKIGEIDKNGFARKPIDWWSYISCFMWCFALLIYLWILGWSKPLLHQVELVAIWVWNVLLTLWDWFLKACQVIWNWGLNWFVTMWGWVLTLTNGDL